MKRLEERIGYRFADGALLKRAMTHSSYMNEKHMPKHTCNERLEFLGDAVLELISSEFLFEKYPEMPEGEMTKLRASLVCEPSLAGVAREIELGQYLLLGYGEDASGGRGRDSITSDALEALIGAIYLDGGFAAAKDFVETFVLHDIENKQLFYDSKTILQEMIQAKGNEKISYRILREEGPDHNKRFCTAVYIGNKMYGQGIGRSKKLAEQEAAYQTILMLQKHETE